MYALVTLGALFVLLSFVIIRTSRRHPTTLVFWMSLSDFFFSLRYLITGIVVYYRYATNETFHIQEAPLYCYLQAISFQVTSWKNRSVSYFFLSFGEPHPLVGLQ
jgi:hypothetical protein